MFINGDNDATGPEGSGKRWTSYNYYFIIISKKLRILVYFIYKLKKSDF